MTNQYHRLTPAITARRAPCGVRAGGVFPVNKCLKIYMLAMTALLLVVGGTARAQDITAQDNILLPDNNSNSKNSASNGFGKGAIDKGVDNTLFDKKTVKEKQETLPVDKKEATGGRFYIRPEVQMIFVPAAFQQNGQLGIGVGGNLVAGYRLVPPGWSPSAGAFNFELSVGYAKVNTSNETSAGAATGVGQQYNIPATVGVGYQLPLSHSFGISTGIDVGAMVQSINRR